MIVVRISTRTSDLYKYTERYSLFGYNFIYHLESRNNWQLCSITLCLIPYLCTFKSIGMY